LVTRGLIAVPCRNRGLIRHWGLHLAGKRSKIKEGVGVDSRRSYPCLARRGTLISKGGAGSAASRCLSSSCVAAVLFSGG
jgi:hypothetical protein